MTDPTALPNPAALPNLGLVVDDHPLRARVTEVLRDEGYRPEIDEDGDVVARVEGQPMFVRCFTTEPPLMRVSSQWMIGEDIPGDELYRLRAANAMTGVLNLIKVTVLDDRLVIAVDLVVHDAMDLHVLLPATLDAVRSGVQTWHSTLLQLLEEAGAP